MVVLLYFQYITIENPIYARKMMSRNKNAFPLIWHSFYSLTSLNK